MRKIKKAKSTRKGAFGFFKENRDSIVSAVRFCVKRSHCNLTHQIDQ